MLGLNELPILLLCMCFLSLGFFGIIGVLIYFNSSKSKGKQSGNGSEAQYYGYEQSMVIGTRT